MWCRNPEETTSVFGLRFCRHFSEFRLYWVLNFATVERTSHWKTTLKIRSALKWGMVCGEGFMLYTERLGVGFQKRERERGLSFEGDLSEGVHPSMVGWNGTEGIWSQLIPRLQQCLEINCTLWGTLSELQMLMYLQSKSAPGSSGRALTPVPNYNIPWHRVMLFLKLYRWVFSFVNCEASC